MRGITAGVLQALCATISGCGASSKTISPVERGTVMYRARVIIEPGPREGEAPRESAPEQEKNGPWQEWTLLYVAAESRQRLQSGDDFELEDTDFAGPAELESRAQIVRGSYGVRSRLKFSEAFGLEGVFGAALHWVETRLESGTASATAHDYFVGPLGGLQLYASPFPFLTIYASGGISFGGGLGAVDIVGAASEAEFGATLDIDRFSLSAGWRFMRLSEVRGDGETDLDVEASGPIVGIGLRF